jgi:serine/threonine-protein kinase
MSEFEPVEGTRVAGRYVVERELGRGATKRVYLARDALTGVRVALALLAREFSGDPMIAARFSREARAASALRSPFIVRVFDVGKLEDQTRYLVLEAVLGRGLDQAMEDGAVEPERAARWALEVLAALHEAHSKGVIHRDVKPENVMLAPTPGGELAKLTDFGLAKVVDSSLDGSLHLHTAANAVLGTPDYMAPEQWKGSTIDRRTDLYAVGVLLYEMLCGRAPFAAKELPNVYAGHLFALPPPFDPSMPAMALALEPVVRRALEKEPNDRFSTALEMAQAIAQVTGVRVPEEAFALATVRWDVRSLRAELVGDALDGPVTVLSTARVVLGRDATADERVRCVRASADGIDGATQERTVSRSHAAIEWRGGHAWIVDLESTTGTTVDGRALGREPIELVSGAVIGLGPFVRYRFVHGACERGELPPWARLDRLDPGGAGHAVLLLLGSEAPLSSDASAALVCKTSERAVLFVRDGRFVLGRGGAERTLEDGGDVVFLDGATINVAIG